MTDTARTMPALRVLLADNQPPGSISEQDVRDVLTTLEARTTISVKEYGALGDGSTDDTVAIQAAITAAEATALSIGSGLGVLTQATVYVPSSTSYYKITAPLNVSVRGLCLRGQNEGVTIKNLTSGSDVVRVNFGGTGALEYLAIEDFRLIGTGATSRAVYLNCCERPRLVRVDCTDHPGVGLYMESTNAVFTGCAFPLIQDFRAQPSAAVKAIYDKGGISPVFLNCTAREAEYGVYLENTRDPVFIGGRYESNNRGTAQTAIAAVTSDGGDTTVAWHRTLTLEGPYFENNLFAVDADAGYRVHLIGGFGSGGANASKVATDVLRFKGGGSVRNFSGQAGVLITAPKGKVDVVACDGVYGLARELQVDGAVPPIPAKAFVNSAVKSWFDTDPAWGASGTNPPTTSADTAVGFLGKNSKKVAWSVGSFGFAYSRTNVTNAVLAAVSGDVFSAMLALKSDVAGELLVVRNSQPGGAMVQLIMVTDTDWHIVMLSSTVSSNGNAFPVLHLGATPAGALNTWVGAVAAALQSNVGFLNTEAPALSFGGVQLQHCDVGGVLFRAGVGTPEAAVTAPVGSLYLRTDGGALTSMYVKETGTGNTGWVAK